jgi:hypothetical protein
MKTLIFCTAYAADSMTWDHKHRLWVNSVRSSGLYHDHLLLPDDASPDVPEWFDAEHIHEPELPLLGTNTTIYRFRENLGRSGIFTQPGWYRSFVFAAVFAKHYGFDKIIHIEADSAVISQHMVSYLNQFSQGWEAFWCPRWNLPETALQVLAGDAVDKLFEFAMIPYWDNFAGRQVDPPVDSGQTSYFPFSINRDFVGDRYGEYTKEIPKHADYACQVGLDIPRWWI